MFAYEDSGRLLLLEIQKRNPRRLFGVYSTFVEGFLGDVIPLNGMGRKSWGCVKKLLLPSAAEEKFLDRHFGRFCFAK